MQDCPNSLHCKPKVPIPNALEPESSQFGDGPHAGDFNHKPVSRPEKVRLVFVITRNAQMRLNLHPSLWQACPNSYEQLKFLCFQAASSNKLDIWFERSFFCEKIHARIWQTICSMFVWITRVKNDDVAQESILCLMTCAISGELRFAKHSFSYGFLQS